MGVQRLGLQRGLRPQRGGKVAGEESVERWLWVKLE